MKTRILIIDDDVQFTEDFVLLLEEDFEYLVAHTPEQGVHILKTQAPDVVLLDLMLGENISGIDVLQDIQQTDPEIPVIIITDHSSIQTAVEAMQKGAFDYISKTPDMEELGLLVQKSLAQRRLRVQNQTLQEEIQSAYYTLIGSSDAMEMVRAKITLFAETLNTVLINGESGVGKELVARQIHLQSDRSDRPFVAINCAALPDQLLESELFGHEKGAFTSADTKKIGKFEVASDGIIFFDEVSELSPEAQAKLLRVLQEKEFERLGSTTTIETDAKVICATNKDLRECVNRGEFREDLYYRLDVLPLHVPPLRDRKEDIPALVDHFTRESCLEMKKPLRQFTEGALRDLQEYDWPGNVRELRNYLTRAIILSEEREIDSTDLPESIFESTGSTEKKNKIPETWAEMDEMRKTAAEAASRAVERRFVQFLLNKFDGNVTQAAEYAGINRSNLHKIIKRCGF